MQFTTAVVTGAACGIGRALAVRLSADFHPLIRRLVDTAELDEAYGQVDGLFIQVLAPALAHSVWLTLPSPFWSKRAAILGSARSSK